NLAGDLAVGVGDRLVELVLVDLDRELDLVPLEGRDGGLHRGESVTARGGTPYYLRWGAGHRQRRSPPGSDRYAVRPSTGSGAVEAHLLWVQEVGGSNPPSPTGVARQSANPRSMSVLIGCIDPLRSSRT